MDEKPMVAFRTPDRQTFKSFAAAQGVTVQAVLCAFVKFCLRYNDKNCTTSEKTVIKNLIKAAQDEKDN